MLKDKLVEIAIILLIVLGVILTIIQPAGATNDDYQYQKIAGILIGEGGDLGEDYEIMACTVRSRLQRGWSLYAVAREYNAKYYQPTTAHIDTLKSIIQSKSDDLSAECNEVHFMYASWYADLWINPNVEPVIIIGEHNYYRYEDYRSLWQK